MSDLDDKIGTDEPGWWENVLLALLIGVIPALLLIIWAS